MSFNNGINLANRGKKLSCAYRLYKVGAILKAQALVYIVL